MNRAYVKKVVVIGGGTGNFVEGVEKIRPRSDGDRLNGRRWGKYRNFARRTGCFAARRCAPMFSSPLQFKPPDAIFDELSV